MISADDQVAAKWHDLHKRAVKLAMTGKVAEAISVIDTFLTDGLAADLRTEALGARADLHAEAGNLQAALADYDTAWPLLVTTYARYSIEVALAEIHGKLREPGSIVGVVSPSVEFRARTRGSDGSNCGTCTRFTERAA